MQPTIHKQQISHRKPFRVKNHGSTIALKFNMGTNLESKSEYQLTKSTNPLKAPFQI